MPTELPGSTQRDKPPGIIRTEALVTECNTRIGLSVLKDCPALVRFVRLAVIPPTYNWVGFDKKFALANCALIRHSRSRRPNYSRSNHVNELIKKKRGGPEGRLYIQTVRSKTNPESRIPAESESVMVQRHQMLGVLLDAGRAFL